MSIRSVRLSDNSSKVSDRVPLTREALVKVRLRALRRGVWFRFLKSVERGLMDLAIQLVDKVRSLVLAKSLNKVVAKLLSAMEGKVALLMRTVGCSLAQKLSEIAQGWGNKTAHLWAADPRFIRYLAVVQKNLSKIFSG